MFDYTDLIIYFEATVKFSYKLTSSKAKLTLKRQKRA